MSQAEPHTVRAAGGVYVPDWLGPQDHPWLAALLDEAVRMAGRPVHEWWARMAEPLRAPAPERRRRLATATLGRLCGAEAIPADPSPAQLREAAFARAQAARTAGASPDVLSAVAAELGLDPTEAVERLYADVPSERRFKLPPTLPSPQELALRTNLAASQALIRSASSLTLRLSSRARPVLRQVLLRRLLCVARPDGDGLVLEVSGPYSLFRHTHLYGRALAAIVPSLRACESFTILARCGGAGPPGAQRTVRLTTGDPIFPPGEDPPAFDSRLEERFARDFARAAPDWDVVREPEPVDVGGAWIFPDFGLVDRRDGQQRWLLEIVGFWTPAYLSAKLDRLRRAGRRDILLCIDEKLACDTGELPPGTPVIRFRTHVDPGDVLVAMGLPRPSAPVSRKRPRLIRTPHAAS